MLLDEECKGCLFKSQLKKVEREQGAGEKLDKFKARVKALCENPPKTYCAPLLMRDIDGIHREIFGCGIDYSREKKLFNGALLCLEEELYDKACASDDPLAEAMKLATAANYIDFARVSDLDESAVALVLEAARRSEPDKRTIALLKEKLSGAARVCYLHDNCGEIVLDKILIRVIKKLYPAVKIYSVVRGGAIINDATAEDAEQVGLKEHAETLDNGTDIPGTYLAEVSDEVKELLNCSDVIVSKGLGNLETLFGEGYPIFYAFTCKCEHIARRFGAKLMQTAVCYEGD